MRRYRNGTGSGAFAIALAVLFVGSHTSAAPDEVVAERLADTTPDPVDDGYGVGWGSVPDDFVRVGSLVFFSAQTSKAGRELWVTDGTENGTRMVVELVPGDGSSSPLPLFEKDGLLYFEANTPLRGRALWSSDGTSQGTVPVDTPVEAPAEPEDELTYFIKEAKGRGRELFATNGKPGGTYLVKDINPGPEHSHPVDFLRVGDVTYFIATTDAEGEELWKTDGTEEGTVLVYESITGPFSQRPSGFANLDDRLLLFHGWWEPSAGGTLWRSDGTEAGTFPLQETEPGVPFPPPGAELSPQNITAVGDGTAYFSGRGELWRTDGTIEGTHLVRDIEPDTPARIERMIPVAGGVFFWDDDDPWSSDGSVNGTGLFYTPSSGLPRPWHLDGNGTSAYSFLDGGLFEAASPASPGNLTPLPVPPHDTRVYRNGGSVLLGDRLLFEVDTDQSVFDEIEMWITDGTPGGTLLVGDTILETFRDRPSAFEDFAILDGSLYAPVSDRILRTDGSPAPDGPDSVTSGYDTGTRGGLENPSSLVALDDRVLFVAWHDTFLRGGARLYAYVPAADEIQLVAADVRTFTVEDGGRPDPLPSLWGIGSRALFVRWKSDGLWMTDGTLAGTEKVSDLTPGWRPDGTRGLSDIAPIRAGTRTYFAAMTPENGLELWRLDDGVAGATLVKDIAPGVAGSRPNGLVPLGSSGYAVFAAADAEHGMELWFTDGTPDGTGLLSDVRPGPDSSSPREITVSGTDVFFTADGDAAGREPWKVSLAGSGLPPEAFDGSNYLPATGQPSPYGAPVGAPQAEIDVKRMKVKLNLRRGAKDSISITGTLPVPVGFEAEGARVLVDVEGHVRRFELNKRGRAKNGKDRFILRLAKRGARAPGSPAVPFSIKLRGDLQAALESAGITGDLPPGTSSHTVRVHLEFAAGVRTKGVGLDYRRGRVSGKGTNPKK